MPSVCCNGCCLVDCIPDCCDRGACGQCWDVCCCRISESSNFDHNDPTKCCCGCCDKPSCCECDECRFNWCMCKCCGGNCIVDPLACCCGEYKGNLAFAEKQVNNAGAPAVEEITR